MIRNKAFLFLFLSPLCSLIMIAAFVFYLIFGAQYKGDDFVFEVKNGEGAASINYRLKKLKVIRSTKVFHQYVKMKDYQDRFRRGNFLIKSGRTMDGVIEDLISGPILGKTVTISEGKNIYEIGKILEAKGVAKASEFIKLVKDGEFIRSVKGLTWSGQGKQNHPPSLEGYLYPDTYYFEEAGGAEHAATIMLREYKNKTRSIDFTNSFKLSPHEVIILASIVEKETSVASERPRIAGLYLNRLRKRMGLQADPTTIYGIFPNFNGNLKKRHLLQKTPYNTYKMYGLPLGPICNPGIESIRAVLNPERHDYLYFVSKNDGTHVFSNNYRAHVNAVNRYQKRRRSRR